MLTHIFVVDISESARNVNVSIFCFCLNTNFGGLDCRATVVSRCTQTYVRVTTLLTSPTFLPFVSFYGRMRCPLIKNTKIPVSHTSYFTLTKNTVLSINTLRTITRTSGKNLTRSAFLLSVSWNYHDFKWCNSATSLALKFMLVQSTVTLNLSHVTQK